MYGRFNKTAAGQHEIQSRTHALPRAVRNLLLVINDTKPLDYWLDSVHGISETDIDLLLAEGLIEPVADGVSARGKPSLAGAVPDSDWTLLIQTLDQADYLPLYDALTAQGKQHLGLMKGYRFVLEVEKCSGPEALRALARKFATQLRDEAGMAAVSRFLDVLRKA